MPEQEGVVVNITTGEAPDPLEIDGREVHGVLNYKGDVSATFSPDKPMGPDQSHQMWWFLKAVYNPTENRTRTYWSLFPPAHIMERMMGQ